MNINFQSDTDWKPDKKEKIACIRMYHDGHFWHYNMDVTKPLERCEQWEINMVYHRLLQLFPNGITDMQAYQAQYHTVKYYESDMFYFGKHHNYWMHLIARPKEHNIYLNCYE